MAKKNKYKEPQELADGESANGGSLVAELQVEQEEKLDFDAWHCMRERQIPKAHHKEIIKADFRGRGLGQHESIKDFDAALAKYGVKLT